MNLTPWRKPQLEERNAPVISFDEWCNLMSSFGGQAPTTMAGQKQESIGDDFRGIAAGAYKSNGVVFACMLVRQLLFSEARFKYRNLSTGQIFGDPSLLPLERPWHAGTTGDLLSKAIQYADLAGNAYFARRPNGRIMPLRPDWVDIIIGSRTSDSVGAWDIDSEVLGYIYTPGGKNSGKRSHAFLAEEVAHFAPIPDPEAQFRGMSWITPIVREVMGDKAATEHKLAFWENAATVNLGIKIDTDDLEKYTGWIEKFKEQHDGSINAYKTLFLGAGADVTPIGANLDQAAFKDVIGAGETRIAAASGTPPILVGLSEGLASATYSNYGMARRRFADGTIRPLWRNLCGSLSPLVNVPGGCELWYDESGIAFLREDQKDAAQILSLDAISTRQLVDGGFDPDSVIAAITTRDLTKLKHTGMMSVQLQPPGSPNTSQNDAGNAGRAIEMTHEVLALPAGEHRIDTLEEEGV